VTHFEAQFSDTSVPVADFDHLPVRARYIAMMPQWDFLQFLAEQGKRYPNFHLLMNGSVEEFCLMGRRATGVYATVNGVLEIIHSDLVVGADGRHSRIRDRLGEEVEDVGAPMDVFWFRLPRREGDPNRIMGRFDVGSIFVLLDRGDYWQCAYVIPKGSAEKVRAEGIEKVRDKIRRVMPAFADRVDELKSMDDLKLLTVGVDRLTKWWGPGVLCIGDAAHTMSPIGGVGINLAIQDAVAASNILTKPLLEHRLRDADLAAVQARRMFPVRATQAMQVFLQNRVIAPSLYGKGGKLKVPFFLRLFGWFPILRRLPARLLGLGVRPEHVQTKPVS
jgi:2-polyprenyl-6-methoxyphenol hydroxylase-like FAD-dependent oxidoreductase